MPANPTAVPTSCLPNTSEVSVYSAPDSVWCAKPPTQNSAIAV